MLPNFIGIGAPKAGTTWLATCLGEHPQVFMAAIKETEFFKLTEFAQRLPDYEAHFRGAERAKAVGEFSVRYLSFPGVPERVKQLIPSARLLVSFRNPVEQVYSNFWHLHRQNFNLPGTTKGPASIEEAMESHRELLLNPARYAAHLARWYEVFPPDQFCVIRFEDIQRSPAEVLRSVFTFLEVNPAFAPPSTREDGSSARRGTSPRNSFLGRMHRATYRTLVNHVYTPLKHALGVRRAARLKDALRVRTVMEGLFMRQGYPPMRQETRARLRLDFADEINELSRLTGMNFDTWQ